eukprot:6843144-Pyramimonas_sp.AAC.1
MTPSGCIVSIYCGPPSVMARSRAAASELSPHLQPVGGPPEGHRAQRARGRLPRGGGRPLCIRDAGQFHRPVLHYDVPARRLRYFCASTRRSRVDPFHEALSEGGELSSAPRAHDGHASFLRRVYSPAGERVGAAGGGRGRRSLSPPRSGGDEEHPLGWLRQEGHVYRRA